MEVEQSKNLDVSYIRGGILMKKVLLVLLCIAVIMTTACSNQTPETSNNTNGSNSSPSSSGVRKNYSMASGSVGGNFYLMGGGLATTINKHLPNDFMFTSETTGGGAANLTMLQNGDAELGISMTSSLFEAHQGEVEWTTGVKHDKTRTALALYPSWLTVYTAANSGIETMEDIEGKIVGLGSKGMAMDAIFRDFFEEKGITPKQIHNDGHGATATALSDGVIDAAILFSYPPFAAISEIENTMDIRFIALTDDEQAFLLNKYNFYTADAMPAGFYKGAPDDVKGVSEWNMLASSSDVPADDVYKIVKALCENQEDMITVHPSAKYMTAENTLNSNVYLHAGTVRYLKEVGINVPSELIPPEYTE